MELAFSNGLYANDITITVESPVEEVQAEEETEEEHKAEAPLIETKNESSDTAFRGRCYTDTGVIVRLRKKKQPNKPSRITLLLNDEPLDFHGDIRNNLPSVKIRRITASKSIKDRRNQLHRISEKDRYVRPRPFWERYEDLKNRNRMSFRNLATAVTLTTLQRVEVQARKWHKIKMRLKDLRQMFMLWQGSLKEIEGRFGMAIMTYFRFVKWLMFLNFYIMIITFFVLMVPFIALEQSTLDFYISNKSIPQYNYSNLTEDQKTFLNTLNCSSEYVAHVEDAHVNVQQHSSAALFLDLIQGTGWMENTLMYYGAYSNRTYYNDGQPVVYSMGVAYLTTFFVTLLLSFILIIKNSAKSMKASHGVEKSVAQFTNKVFGGWDYCIKEEKTAENKKSIIGIALAADLEELNRKKKRKEMKFLEKLEIWGMRIVINILTIILLLGSLALIGFTTERMISVSRLPQSNIGRLFLQYVPYITITLLNIVVPRVFQKLVIFEDYRHEFEIRITLARCILLRLSSPVALMVILYYQLIAGSERNKNCGNRLWYDEKNTGSIKCWETYVGQQIYKLVLMDTVINILVVGLWHFPRNKINKKYRERSKIVKFVGPQEFDLPKSVVDIIYAQNLCWFGMFFSPMIPLITFIHTIIIFYLKKFDLLNNCRPESRPYKTSKSTSLFMKVLLLSFIMAVVPVGYLVGNVQPSQSCGPFRAYSNTDSQYRIYTSLLNSVRSWDRIPQAVFFFLGTGIFIVPVIVMLLLCMSYYWVIGSGYSSKEEIVLEDLKMEKMDKKFLLKQISEEREKIWGKKDSDC